MRVLPIVAAMLIGATAAAPTLAQVTANPPVQGAALLAALRAGGYILYFRHTDTDWSQRDTRGVSLDDCAAQRNLSDRGRDHARAIGEAIRALGVPIGAVLASPLCRTVETAMLIFGAAEKSMAVREGGPLPPGSPGRYVALHAMLSAPPAPRSNAAIVGHAYPFYALVGGQYLEEGEAAVVRPLGTSFEVLARVGLKEWRDLATPPAAR
jgi:phosphohistidine phosphatase SixA